MMDLNIERVLKDVILDQVEEISRLKNECENAYKRGYMDGFLMCSEDGPEDGWKVYVNTSPLLNGD